MELFKFRLKEIFGLILLTLILFLFCVVPLYVMSLISDVLVPITLMVIIVVVVAYYLWIFINWLFIEPFRKEKLK